MVTADGEIPNSYTVKNARATRLDLSLRETPQSVTVITRQRLDDMGLFSPSDVMGQASACRSPTASASICVSRGYTIDNFQIDGMLNTFGGSVKTNTDSVIYERIEVIRGATGLTTGAGDPSGTISMIRKRPTDTFQMGANLARGTLGQPPPGSRSRWSGCLGRPHPRVVAAKQQSDSFRDVMRSTGMCSTASCRPT